MGKAGAGEGAGLKPKKPRKPDPFKGMKKIIPIRPPEKELSFEEKVEKFGEYMHDPEQHGKIFSELGFTFVDDVCEGECESCCTKADCTVYKSVKVVPCKKK
jgi:hypothetical protein